MRYAGRFWAALVTTIALTGTGHCEQGPFINDSAYAAGEYGEYPVEQYVTYNGLVPRLHLSQHDPSCDDGRYYVFTPFNMSTNSICIFDTKGRLVWHKTGGKAKDRKSVSNAQIQQYRGRPYLIYWQGDDTIIGHGAGDYYMLDTSYNLARKISAHGDHKADFHDFTITEQGTALITAYSLSPANLSHWGGDPNGFAWDSVFQEIDIETGRLIFQWQASDHWTFDQMVVDSYSRKDVAATDGFDWFHINSVVKDHLGNYLLSSRYASTVSYVNGQTGQTIWNLGGRRNDFQPRSDASNSSIDFFCQHNARWADEDLSQITLFDNGAYWGDKRRTAQGLRISLDTENMTSEIVAAWQHPAGQWAESAGGMSIVPASGNVVISYGYQPVISEFSSNGTLLCDIDFGSQGVVEAPDSKRHTYRAYKEIWHGRPTQNPSTKMLDGVLYVSWNGATDVSVWALDAEVKVKRFKDWVSAGETAKEGFETSIVPQEVTSGKLQRYRLRALGDERQQLAAWFLDTSGNIKETSDRYTEVTGRMGLSASMSGIPPRHQMSIREPCPRFIVELCRDSCLATLHWRGLSRPFLEAGVGRRWCSIARLSRCSRPHVLIEQCRRAVVVMFSRCALLCLSLGVTVRADPRNPLYGPFETIRTEPDFQVHTVNVSITPSDSTLLSPGFYFLAPSTLFALGFGAHIIDQNGQLVWYGNDSISGKAVDFYASTFGNGLPNSHLFISQGRNDETEIRNSHGVFLDDTYTQTSPNFEYDANFPEYWPGEAHEFNVLASGSSYITSTRTTLAADLTPYHGPKNGTVFNACWQHIDIPSYREKSPLFTWCALDPGRLAFDDTEVYLNLPSTKAAGNYTDGAGGLGIAKRPWDLFHQNAIDADGDGNYLVSLRHSDQIILVAGPNTTFTNAQPGDIIWRLGGTRNNDFLMEGAWSFSRQHHIRYIESNETHQTFSLFNNGWTDRLGDSLASSFSSGQIISVDNSTMTAHLVHQYLHPFGSAANVSIAQGGTQILPDGNVVVGWGSVPEITEYTANGEVLWHARFAGMDRIDMNSYRAYKFPWTGRPQYPPKLLPYRESCVDNDSPLLAYVSWNGATEVNLWHFWVRIAWPWPWLYAGHVPKQGFETQTELDNLDGASRIMRFISDKLRPHWRDVHVQGSNSYGEVLGETSAATFVPRADLAGGCDRNGCACDSASLDDQGCNTKGNFLYAPTWSCGPNECQSSSTLVAMAAVLATMLFTLAMAARLTKKHRRWRTTLANLHNILESGYSRITKGTRSWLNKSQAFGRNREPDYHSLPLDDFGHHDHDTSNTGNYT